MSSPADVGLSELIAVHVAHRFQMPPRVVAIVGPADIGPLAYQTLKIFVTVETHFQSLVRGQVIHGWRENDPDIEAVLTAVDMSLDIALGQKTLEDHGYLTDMQPWSMFEDFPYSPPDWFGTDSPDFEGDEDAT